VPCSPTLRKGKPNYTVELWRSDDLGKSWSKTSDVTGNIGGNPPATVLLPDGRLCVTYGYRKKPFGMRARISDDEGSTWTPRSSCATTASTAIFGYSRNAGAPDGRVLTIYYFNGPQASDRAIEGTFWTPRPNYHETPGYPFSHFGGICYRTDHQLHRYETGAHRAWLIHDGSRWTRRRLQGEGSSGQV